MAVAVITSLQQLLDNSGNVLNGGSVTVYEDGTTTPIQLYSDDALGSTATNPITLDSAGRHAMRYFSAQSYKILVKNSAGSTIYTRDDIDPGVPIGTGVLAIANGGTGAATAGAAVTALGAATQSSVDDLAADVAALAGAASSVEKTHIATGTTAQRPSSPADGDIRRNTTIPQWEGYSGAAAAWQKLMTSTDVDAAVGLRYLSTQSASASATIDFTTNLSDSYEEHVIKFSSVKPATDDTSLWVRIGTGGGPTYQTSGYEYGFVGVASGADAATVRSTSDAKILLNNSSGSVGMGNASGEYASGEIRFSNPEGTDYCVVDWTIRYVNAAGRATFASGSGMYSTTGAITGVRFMMSSGNITSGTFRHYGIKES